MKKLISVLLILATLALAGCSNRQRSSREEARYVAEHQKDFYREILLERIDSGDAVGIFFGPDQPIWGDRGFASPLSHYFSYIVIYETKEGKKKLLLMRDHRPPVIVGYMLLEAGQKTHFLELE